MPGTNRAYWLHVLTPTHVGTGRGIGYIDLPVQRDKVTGWPLVPGSAFKGVWADAHRATADNRKTDAKLRAAFGVADNDANGTGSNSGALMPTDALPPQPQPQPRQPRSNSGALMPTDARLVCLPVRSFRGTFAWVTSRMALHLLHRDLALAGFTDLPAVPEAPAITHAKAVLGKCLLKTDGPAPKVYLEDLDFTLTDGGPPVAGWAAKLAGWVFPGKPDWQAVFTARFVVLPDEVFDFLTVTGTEVNTRVKIDDASKTVADGQLWTEEALPAETILCGLVACDRVYGNAAITREDLLTEYATGEKPLQIGGKATVGKGRVRCVFTA